jgi:hypothetical protein
VDVGEEGEAHRAHFRSVRARCHPSRRRDVTGSGEAARPSVGGVTVAWAEEISLDSSG